MIRSSVVATGGREEQHAPHEEGASRAGFDRRGRPESGNAGGVIPGGAQGDVGAQDGTRGVGGEAPGRRVEDGAHAESRGAGGEAGDQLGVQRQAEEHSDVRTDEAEIVEGEGEHDMEIRRHRKSRIPRAPTLEENAAHVPLHLPFRSWCPVCVQAAGVHDHHRAHASESSELIGTTISLDYCFQGGQNNEEDMAFQGNYTVLIMHDDSIDGIWALQVEAKGVRPEVIDWVMQRLEEAGHAGTEITLKTDQEESIVALKRAIASRRNARTTLIESQVRVSKTNAKVERAIANGARSSGSLGCTSRRRSTNA